MRTGSVSGASFFHPLFHHLRIAECAETVKEFARNFAHRWPGRIRIYFLHHRRDGAAAPHGYTKIVDRVGIG